LPLYTIIRLTNCHVKLNSTPTLRRRDSGANGPPLEITALFLYSHSASPRLERTGYGTWEGAAEVTSIGMLFI